MKILYVKNIEKMGYYKISAIVEDDFVFGSAELNENNFGIVTMDVPGDIKAGWSNKNQYCLNQDCNAIIETPEEYLIPYNPQELIEVNNQVSEEYQIILDEAKLNAERFLSEMGNN